MGLEESELSNTPLGPLTPFFAQKAALTAASAEKPACRDFAELPSSHDAIDALERLPPMPDRIRCHRCIKVQATGGRIYGAECTEDAGWMKSMLVKLTWSCKTEPTRQLVANGHRSDEPASRTFVYMRDRNASAMTGLLECSADSKWKSRIRERVPPFR